MAGFLSLVILYLETVALVMLSTPLALIPYFESISLTDHKYAIERNWSGEFKLIY